MKVVNIGHDKLILTEYNGRKYAFHYGVPMEISPEVYNNIILSGHVNAQDIVPVEEKTSVEKPGVVAKAAAAIKSAVKSKGKRHGK